MVYQEETLKNVIRSVTRNGRSIILTAILALILVYLFSIIGFLFFQDDFQLEVENMNNNNLNNDDDTDSTVFSHIDSRLMQSKEFSYNFEQMDNLSDEWNFNGPMYNVYEVNNKSFLFRNHMRKYCEQNEFSEYCFKVSDDYQYKPTMQIKYVNEYESENLIKKPVEEENETSKERACDSLLMCIITTLNHGLRNGGGIGDVLRSPSSNEALFVARVIYDLLFFFIVIIIILNLIFGVIIDTFADLRSEKQQKEEILRNTCFICGTYLLNDPFNHIDLTVGLERSAFDNKSVSFEEHTCCEHNMWHYLYFIVLVRVKDPTEFTGPESYVASMIKERNLDWFPRMRAMSLAANDSDNEQNEIRTLQTQLELTHKQMSLLSKQLNELKEQVSKFNKINRFLF